MVDRNFITSTFSLVWSSLPAAPPSAANVPLQATCQPGSKCVALSCHLNLLSEIDPKATPLRPGWSVQIEKPI